MTASASGREGVDHQMIGAALSPGCITLGEEEGRRGGGPMTSSLTSPSALGRGLVFIPAAMKNKETLVFTTLTTHVLTLLFSRSGLSDSL